MERSVCSLLKTKPEFISDVVSSRFSLLTKLDFESICGVQNRALKTPTSPSKSVMGNGTLPQTPKDELHKFKGSICMSPTGSDRQSPVSSPKGKPELFD